MDFTGVNSAARRDSLRSDRWFRLCGALVVVLGLLSPVARANEKYPKSLADAPLAVQHNPTTGKPMVPGTGASYTPSPKDWRDQTIYFAFVDRFARGQRSKTHGNPADGTSWHGGNIKGVIEKLDYIKGMGTKTIWITPVLKNEKGTYHGYAATNFLRIDPRFGTMKDMKNLVQQAHSRGMRVVMDIVVNHTGKVFEYKGGNEKWVGLDGPPKEIGKWTQPIYPKELQKAEAYTRRGTVDAEHGGWNDKNQSLRGDFPGQSTLRDLATNKKEVVDTMAHVYKWWIKQTDVDGFRIDTVKHVDKDAWKSFNTQIREYAGSLGKKNFLLMGEVFDGSHKTIASYVGNKLGYDQTTGRAQGMSSAFDIPAAIDPRTQDALHGRGPTSALEDREREIKDGWGKDASKIGRIADNHDVPRYLKSGEDWRTLKTAMAYTLLSRGIPTVYYGTEQAFRQPDGKPSDPGNREDMFAGKYESKSSKGNNFKTRAAMYRFIRRVNGARDAYPALRRGAQFQRWNDPKGPGIYAFSRIFGKQEVTVVMNTSNKPQSVSGMWVDNKVTPGGTKLIDAMQPSYKVEARAADGGSKLDVTVPPFSVRILVHQDEYVHEPERRFDAPPKPLAADRPAAGAVRASASALASRHTGSSPGTLRAASPTVRPGQAMTTTRGASAALTGPSRSSSVRGPGASSRASTGTARALGPGGSRSAPVAGAAGSMSRPMGATGTAAGSPTSAGSPYRPLSQPAGSSATSATSPGRPTMPAGTSTGSFGSSTSTLGSSTGTFGSATNSFGSSTSSQGGRR
jgi:glycosidase